MIEAWWKAHEFEYLVGAIAIAVGLVALGIWALVVIIVESRARTRRLDAMLEAARAHAEAARRMAEVQAEIERAKARPS